MGMIKIDEQTIKDLIEKSRVLPKKRASHIVRSFRDKGLPSVLFNVLQLGTYVCPHRHISEKGKEILIPINGNLVIILFDEQGNITENIHLSPDKISYLEIPSKTFHTIIAKESDIVLCEIYMDNHKDDGEYKEFAPWAPEECSSEGDEYLERLIAEVS